MSTPLKNAMTVDVEDYFQVSAFEKFINPDDWDSIECRIPGNMDRILDLFAKADIKATFFVLGWVAERFPELIRQIVEQGHEIASHGWSHVRVVNHQQADFSNDIKKTKDLLEDISGQPVKGYRAASYSVTSDTLWAYDSLAEAGYEYSSSIFPIKHDLYGIPAAPRKPFVIKENGLLEIPLTTVRMFGKNLPCSGGGWFRLMPYSVFKAGLKKVNEQDRLSGIFYFHPWEIDPGQPRQENLPFKTIFRHYLNLERMENRLISLLNDFSWDSMENIFLNHKTDYPQLSLKQIG